MTDHAGTSPAPTAPACAKPRGIRLGFTVGDYPRPPAGDAGLFDTVVAQAQAAERAGFDSFWVPDHLMQTPAVAPKEEPMFECYTTLGALAALTSTLRLGAFVGCAAYRHPGLVAKAVTTLDVISHGRAVFGIGAGWYGEEHHAYGYELGTVADRFGRLVDTLEIVRALLADGEATYAGRHYRVDGALNSPGPLQPGGPPILVGGSGEKQTLRLVAEYADICNVTGSPNDLRRLMGVLDAHCEAVGRDPVEICRTFTSIVVVRDTEAEARAAVPAAYRRAEPTEVARNLAAHTGPIAGTRDQVVELLRAHLDAGLDGVVLSCVAQDRHPDYVEMLGELAREALA
ncbi:MAG TPA: TIGR03560 family F420-dependent LLM class oxidoreductase [Acidimicrobiales bacterium]